MKPKPDPVITRGRLLHALWGAAITWTAYRVGGYDWLPAGLAAALSLGIAWEKATPVLARVFRWKFRDGNAWDAAWWAVGGIVVIGVVEVLAR